MKKPRPEQLPRREREVLNVVFASANRVSVEEIRQQLTNPPSYSAVRAMLTRLENKGYLRHQADGQRYLYSAAVSPGSARRASLQQYVRTFFGGSLSQMMTALVRHETWTDEELDALQAEIERAKNERKQR